MRNIYEFTCPTCGASGEAGIPRNMGTLIEHGCGQLFAQHQASGKYGSKPKLVAITNGGTYEWQSIRSE